MNDKELDAVSEKNIEDLKNIVSSIYHDLEKVSRIIENIDKEKRKVLYKNMPGVSGYFDGFYLVGEDGSKYEVPANYAAKSRIVFGDTLKMIEEGGKQLFKQVEKVPRKKLEGVLSKKEGKWYILTDSGSFKVSDIAADFHKAALNDKAYVYVPENAQGVTYAALDYLEKENIEAAPEQPVKTQNPQISVKIVPPVKKEAVQNKPKPVEKKKLPPVERPKQDLPKPQVKKDKEQPVIEPKVSKEYIANIMEDDDLR